MEGLLFVNCRLRQQEQQQQQQQPSQQQKRFRLRGCRLERLEQSIAQLEGFVREVKPVLAGGVCSLEIVLQRDAINLDSGKLACVCVIEHILQATPGSV